MDEKSEALEFPINKELLGEATRVKENWKVVKDRLKKIEDHRDKVSPPVYERVRADYEEKLKEATEGVLEKKHAIDRELVTLYETQKKITSQLDTHRHTLEEIKFRNVLGEFTEEEYQRKAKEEQEKISKFETILSSVNTNIGRYEELFHEEVELLSLEEGITAEEEEIPAEKPISEEYLEGAEAHDYFTGGEVTAELDEERLTHKEARGKQAKKPAVAHYARVVIISGDDAGATYPIKDAITFGRAESNTVVLRDAKASRQHAKIVQRDEEYVLIDLNSSNGTFVNNERIEEYVLTNNDEFEIGNTVLQFQS